MLAYLYGITMKTQYNTTDSCTLDGINNVCYAVARRRKILSEEKTHKQLHDVLEMSVSGCHNTLPPLKLTWKK